MYDLPHSYKIIDKRTNKVYIGICVKKDKTYLDRFEDHLDGKGSQRIAELLDQGYSKSDFEIEFIEYYADAFEASRRETELIKEYNSYSDGLNGNGGGGFGNYAYKSFWNEMCWKLDRSSSDFGLSKIVFDSVNSLIGKNEEFRSRSQFYKHFREVDDLLKNYDIWNENHINLFFERFGNSGLSYTKLKEIIDTVKFNSLTKKKIINILLTENDYIKILRSVLRYIRENKNTTAYKHTQVNKQISEHIFRIITGSDNTKDLSKIKGSMLGRYTEKKTNPAETDGWKIGRMKFRERMKSKDFTEKELSSYENKRNRLRKEWKNKSDEEIKQRTSNGLTSMNKKDIICPYCNKTNLSKGNAKRWHFDNCKFKEINTL